MGRPDRDRGRWRRPGSGPTPTRRIVAALAARPGSGATVAVLAAASGLAEGELRRRLAGLEWVGMIERRPDPVRRGDDRVRLTPAEARRLGLAR